MSKIVERTLDFIELFAAQQRPLTLTDISRLLKIPFSSCHDVLQALQARGYLYEIGPRAGFYPTIRLLNLATTIAQHDPIAQHAEGLLRKLRDDIEESVSLAKVDGLTATYLLVLEPGHPLKFLVTVGSRIRSLHATSAGKTLLGSLPPAAFEQYLKSAKLVPMTPRSIKSKAALRADIQEGARRGWFLNCEESVEGATTISVPFKWNGSLYIITVAGVTARMQPKLDRVTRRAAEAARLLSAAKPDAINARPRSRPH
jgi:DNA-binding IclR family transcriptional regulator